MILRCPNGHDIDISRIHELHDHLRLACDQCGAVTIVRLEPADVPGPR